MLLLLLLLPVFSYRFPCVHPDIYCLWTKVYWPNSSRDQGPYTRDQGPLTKFLLVQGPKRDGTSGQIENMIQKTGKQWKQSNRGPLNWNHWWLSCLLIVIWTELNGQIKRSLCLQSIERLVIEGNAAASLNTFNDVKVGDVIECI